MNSNDSVFRFLPAWMEDDLKRVVKDKLKEIRLRLGKPPEIITGKETVILRRCIEKDDLKFCINAASSYSPWAAATLAQGYLTVAGGHRIGVCGKMIFKDGITTGFREINSLCIRIASDYKGIAEKAAGLRGSILIIGAPGWGKTTLLRDLIRYRSAAETVAVVDEREELFPEGFEKGKRMDVISGCSKSQGILQVLRTMGPETIAVDEITDQKDCEALMQSFYCGVHLLATAHASSLQEFKKRKNYQSLLNSRMFSYVLILRKDQTYQVERMEL